MMRSICFLSGFALCVGAAGCASLTRPIVTKHYTAWTADTVHPDSAPWATVSVFSLPVAGASTPRDLFTLAGEGQAALIEAVAAKSENAGALTRALAARIADDPGATALDLTRFKRRIVFSVENTSMSPADRISSAVLRLGLDGRARFVNWDKLASERQVVDLGSLTFTQTNTVGGELGIANNDPVPKATVSSGAQLAETSPLRRRVVTLSGALSPTEARLIQQTASGEDLTGNVVVDFEIKMAASADTWITHVSHARKADGSVNCDTPPTIRRQRVTYPASADSMVGDVTLDYTVRRVRHGHQTIMEGDDRVSFITGRTAIPDQVIIPTADLVFRVWRLRSQGRVLHARLEGSGGNGHQLEFASPEDAMRLADWLSTCGAAPVSGYRLMLGYDVPLADKDKRAFSVRLINKNGANPPADPLDPGQ